MTEAICAAGSRRLRGGVLILLLLAVSMGAAASDSMSPAPKRGADPFSGILDAKTLAVSPSTSIPGASGLRVAVILSEATEKHLKWCEMASHGWSANTNYWTRAQRGQAYLDHATRLHVLAYDPKRVVAGAVDPLVRKSASVGVVSNYAEFLQGDYDLLAVTEVTFVNVVPRVTQVFGAGGKWGMYISIRFVDRNSRIVGVVDVGETRPTRLPPEMMDDAIEIQTAVLAAYQSAMDRLLGPDKPQAQVAPESTPPKESATVPGIADRLKELEDLVRRGLVTPAEAEAMRKKILGL